MLVVALSCLQGRPMRAAFDELLPLADGVQLTPGNVPTPEFAAHIASAQTLVHHGFAFDARRTRVWGPSATPLVARRSVHAPETVEASFGELQRAIDAVRAAELVLETMYPGFALGSAGELAWAMAEQLPLAVDISHLAIQRTAGVLDERTLARLLDYDRIAEVHVSQSDGVHDRHAPLTADTFGLTWARARQAAGTPVVIECYMHRLSRDERRRQIELARPTS
jgi:hypothetical protein